MPIRVCEVSPSGFSRIACFKWPPPGPTIVFVSEATIKGKTADTIQIKTLA